MATLARLYDQGGAFLVEIGVPDYAPPADGLTWQTRFFVFREVVMSAPNYLRYDEGVLHVDATTSPIVQTPYRAPLQRIAELIHPPQPGAPRELPEHTLHQIDALVSSAMET